MKQVTDAREEIMKVARKMYRDGELEVDLGGEEYVE
jgi:flagellar motor switch protein FliG